MHVPAADQDRSRRAPGFALVAAGAVLLAVTAAATWPRLPAAPEPPRVSVVAPPAETTDATLELRLEVEAATPWVDLTVGDQTTRVAPGAQAVQVALTPGANRLEVVAVDAEGRRSAPQVVTIQRRE